MVSVPPGEKIQQTMEDGKMTESPDSFDERRRKASQGCERCPACGSYSGVRRKGIRFSHEKDSAITYIMDIYACMCGAEWSGEPFCGGG